MTAQKRVKDNQLIGIIIVGVVGFLGPPWEENIKPAFQVGTAFLSTCSHLTKWIFARCWLALNPQQRLSFACSIQGPLLEETLGDMRKKMECCVGGGKDIKKSFLATGHPLIIHSLSGISLLAIGPQIAMKCNLDLISTDCLREKDVARPAGAWGGFDECLVRHLTVGKQKE